MFNAKKKEAVDIFPLSCNPALDSESIPGIASYCSLLKKIFKNRRINNIAITGQFGVGKSSLIKSFDSRYRRFGKREPKFLYVSMGQYSNQQENKQNDQDSTGNVCKGCCKSGHGSEAEFKSYGLHEQNAIERRILLQLSSKFSGHFFPYSSFRLFPAKPGIVSSFGFVLSAMSALLLFLKQPLADLLKGWSPYIRRLEKPLEYVLKWHKDIEVVLYLLVFGGIAVLIWNVFRWLLTKGRNLSFDIKTSAGVDCNVGQAGCEDYLDQYTQELVYCLSSIGRKIDYTVVFEDMDRLKPEHYIPIFTRLREINHILNTRMKPRKHIRFVFVINDEVVDLLDYHKFFDIIIPVIPTLNEKSAEIIFGENLKKINAAVEIAFVKQCKKEKNEAMLGERKCEQCTGEKCVSVKCFYKDMEKDDTEIVQWAAKALVDYRKLYTILNEYSLALRLYFCNSKDKLTCLTAKQILAFYLYKHIWSQDYQKLIENSADAAFFTGKLESGTHEDLFQKLYAAGLFNVDSLYSVGFSREKIAAFWEKRLAGGNVEKVIGMLIQAKGYNYPEIQDLVRKQCSVQSNPNNELTDGALKAAIEFVLRAPTGKPSPNNWFFENRDSDKCLEVMAELSDEDVKKFIEQCKPLDEKWNIFEKCSKIGSKLVHDNKWTLQMAKVYAWGVHPDLREASGVRIKGGDAVKFDEIMT